MRALSQQDLNVNKGSKYNNLIHDEINHETLKNLNGIRCKHNLKLLTFRLAINTLH